MKIVVFPRLGLFGRRWYFHVLAVNGKVIAQSEGYRNRADCVATAQSLRRGLFDAEISYG